MSYLLAYEGFSFGIVPGKSWDPKRTILWAPKVPFKALFVGTEEKPSYAMNSLQAMAGRR